MSETSDTSVQDQQAETSTQGADDGSGKQTAGMQAALMAEREKRQVIEAQLAELKAAQEKAAQEAAAKRGEFEKLYNDLKAKHDPLLEQFEALSGREKARIEALEASNTEALKALPEGLRDLVPEGLDPEATAKQIAAVKLLVKDGDTTPRGGINPRTQPKQGETIPKQYLDRANTEAARYDMEPLQYWKVRLKPLLKRQGKLTA